MRRPRLLVLAAAAAFAPSLAGAVTLPAGTTVTIQVAGDPTTYTLTGSGTVTDLGVGEIGWTLNDVNGANPGVWGVAGLLRVDSWTASVKEDPFVTNNLSVLNVSSSPQTYTATVTLPIPGGFSYSQIIDSSVGITITDTLTTLDGTSPDGASIASTGPSGTGIYTGLINGVDTLALFPHTSTLSCGSNGCSIAQSDPLSGDFDGPAGPGTATSIAIRLQFTLGPGDSAAITSRFEIVPEPATLALFGAGLAGMALLGRRRA